jgi:uncharacterized protein YjlB
VEGDYFELMVRVESDTSVSVLDLGSLFSMEIVGPAVVSGIVPAATGMPWKGASVSLTANESIANATVTEVPFDQADKDIGGWWDSAAPTRLTVPAGITKVRLHAGFLWDAVTGDRCFLRIIMNGATVSGGGGSDLDQQYSQLSQSHATPTIVVSEGDYFEVQAYQNSGIAANLLTNNNTYFSIEAVESIAPSVTPRGALVTKSANQSIANSTSTAITWDQETYDSDNLHDNATNNSRMTVPAGVTHVRLDASITFAVHGTGYRTVYFYKNGTTIVSRIQIDPSATADTMMSLSSQVLEVVEGDYFEVWVKHTRGAALNVNTGVASWFNMEIVGPTVVTTTETSAGQPFKGALVTLAADETAANYTTASAVSFDEEVYDTGGWHSNATNPTRLTVPAGVTKVRIDGGAVVSALTAGDTVTLAIYKNGSLDWAGSPHQYSDTGASSIGVTVSTGAVEVAEGDYFELFLDTQADASITVLDNRTWLSIEAVESIAPATTPRGCLVHNTADLTVKDYSTAAAVTFDAEVYDTDDLHDNVTNNSRITIPAGVTHVRLSGQMYVNGTLTGASYLGLQIRKNGAVDYPGSSLILVETSGPTFGYAAVTSPVLEVIEGDYFEMYALCEDSSITVDNDLCWFACEVVTNVVVPQGASRGALAYEAADDTAQNYSSLTSLTWDTDDFDTDSLHDVSTNTERMTVPSGVSKVRLAANVHLTSLSVDMWAFLGISKNTSLDYPGVAETMQQVGTTGAYLNCRTGTLRVVPGDYFEVEIQVETDTSVTRDASQSWFEMEIVE